MRADIGKAKIQNIPADIEIIGECATFGRSRGDKGLCADLTPPKNLTGAGAAEIVAACVPGAGDKLRQEIILTEFQFPRAKRFVKQLYLVIKVVF